MVGRPAGRFCDRGHLLAGQPEPVDRGLEAMRYSAESLQAEFEGDFELVDSAEDLHRTPAGGEQKFTYFLLRFKD